MSNLAESLTSLPAYIEDAVVIDRRDARVTVAAGHRRASARRAASCLLEPREGDRVLTAAVGSETFVLAVLERDRAEPARLSVDGDLELRLRGGRFRVDADDGIELRTGDEASLSSRRLRIDAIDGKVVMEGLRVLAGRVGGQIGTLRLVAAVVDTVAERLRQKLQRSYRFVDEIDQVRAGTIDYGAAGFARIHAEDSVVTADKLVKIDGEQIHVG
jgi:hypothetical protein